MRSPSRLFPVAGLLLAAFSFTAPKVTGQDEAPKHYLTFQIGYVGTATASAQGPLGQNETRLEVANHFSGRIEVRPSEVADIPQSPELQLKQAEAIQRAVLAGDFDQLKKVSPSPVVAWFPIGDTVEVTGKISETMTSSSSSAELGESRAASDHRSESYSGQKVYAANVVSTFVKIRTEEHRYDIQFTLMPDMAATQEAVSQNIVIDHKEAGHDTHKEISEKVPLDMGPGQMKLGYSNYRMVADVKGEPLAGDAGELIGTTRIPVPKPAGWEGAWDIALELSWQIDITLPPVELVITADGYDAWRPEGSIKKPAEPGNHLVARATVIPKEEGTGKFVPRVKNIRFELLDTSREPGVCLNWPLGAKDRDYDLRLAAVSGGTLSNSDQKLEVTDPRRNEEGHTYAEAQIDSYDFGGRASFRAICTLNDGREIEGVMKGEGGDESMPRLPKMKGPGWIAESWRKEHQAEKLADDDDNEEVKGQKDNGDGYTLYEEYRGWVVNGKHLEGDPERKDFFVLNLIGGDARPGIELFENLSKLRVHSKLRRTEMSQADRLMNGNRRDAPHRVEQHGVWVKTFTRDKLGDNGADTPMTKAGVAGRPGITKGVGILARGDIESIFNKPFNLPARDTIFAYDRAIAHELLHTVGVEHHGTGDYRQILGYVSPRNPYNKIGRPYYASSPNSAPTVVLDEAGYDLASKNYPDYVKMREFADGAMLERELAEGSAYIARNGVGWGGINTPQQYADQNIELLVIFCFMHLDGHVGVQQGESSGAQDCVMRYYFSTLYEAIGRKDTLYLATPGSERIGIAICHSGAGTGINAAGHKPQSRYGNTAAGEGDCFSQICPNDAIPPRKVKK